ncbi:hypothetical protein ACT3CD_05025 [Geofilum sp. OHC36d9]|uniref:hypothetical protein n=1 Tax=Geofilum sp. OHC36d9 TaxID=3458413 RepID=UPI004033BA1E
MNKKHNIFIRLHLIKPTGFMLLAIHLFIALSYTLFLHSHTLDNGEVITHSHPYAHPFAPLGEKEKGGHHHNHSAYQILPNLHHFMLQEIPAGLFIVTVRTYIFLLPQPPYHNVQPTTNLLRGPPAFIA